MSLPDVLPLRGSKSMRLRPPPTWLWFPYIPYGRLTLVDGSEGIGKGFFCVHLAMMILTSGQDVLWLTAEDDPEEDLYRRLKASGYDEAIHGEVHFYDGAEENSPIGIPRDWRRLASTIADKQPRLVICDPGRSFLSSGEGQQMSYNDDAQVRPGLQKMNMLAAKSGVALPFIHHWKRDSSVPPSERFAGAGTFAQAARHRVTLARYGDEIDAEACFAVTKTNITTRGHLRHYELSIVPDYESARFEEMGPNAYDATLDAWWKRKDSAAKRGIEMDQTDEVLDWLRTNATVEHRLPTREVTQRLSGVPAKYVKSAYQKLRDDGSVKDTGRGGLILVKPL